MGHLSSHVLYRNGIVLGQGAADDLIATLALTDGQLLVGSTGNKPLPTTVTGPGVTAGAGSLAIATNAVLVFGCAGVALVATQQRYIGSFLSSVATDVEWIAPYKVTARNLNLRTSAVPGVGETMTAFLMLNSSASALTCVVSGGSSATAVDATHTVAVAVGDRLAVGVAASAGCATMFTNATVELVWVP